MKVFEPTDEEWAAYQDYKRAFDAYMRAVWDRGKSTDPDLQRAYEHAYRRLQDAKAYLKAVEAQRN